MPNSPDYPFGTYLKSLDENRKMNMKTDIQVQQDVLAELKWEPSVNVADIGAEVKDGIVTLAGHVDSYVENGMPSALLNASPVSRRSPSKSTSPCQDRASETIPTFCAPQRTLWSG